MHTNYKQPRPVPSSSLSSSSSSRIGTPITVPRTGARSQDDRTNQIDREAYSNQRSPQKRTYGGQHRQGGSHHRGGGSWYGGGQDGFALPVNGYTEGEYNALAPIGGSQDRFRVKDTEQQAVAHQKELVAMHKQKRAAEEEERRRKAERAAEQRQMKEREEEEKSRVETQKAKAENERANREMREAYAAKHRKKNGGASTSSTSASMSRNVSSTSSLDSMTFRRTDGTGINLTEERLRAEGKKVATTALGEDYLSRVTSSKKRNNDDDQDLVIVSTTTKSKKGKEKEVDREQSRSKGKGKEKMVEDIVDPDSPRKKKTSKDSKFRKLGGKFDDGSASADIFGKKSSDKASSSRRSKSPIRNASPSLADQYRREREDAEFAEVMDAQIAEQTRKSQEDQKKERRKSLARERDDSDLEVVEDSREGGRDRYLSDGDDEDGPQREDTPDELLDDDEEQIDPSTLCPFCDQSLPQHPSTRLVSLKNYLLSLVHVEHRTSLKNPYARFLPITEIASFCQLHREERTIIPDGRAKGYPITIDWANLPARIETSIAPLLIRTIEGIDSNAFVDQAQQDWEKHGAYKRNNVTTEWDSFHFEEPGYYGPRGFECIHSTVRRLFIEEQPLLTPSHIGSLSPDFYIRRVLVPTTALELIRSDRSLEQTEKGTKKAKKVLEESRAFGKAMYGIVEDVSKEFAIAKEEERRAKEKRAEEEVEEQKRRFEAVLSSDEEEEEEGEDDEGTPAPTPAQAPTFRVPKALAMLRAASTSQSKSTPQPKSSAASNGSTSAKRQRSPELNLDDLRNGSASTSKPTTTSKPSSTTKTQPSIESIWAKMGSIFDKSQSKPVSNQSKAKSPISLSSDDELPVVTLAVKKKKKRQISPTPELESPRKKKKQNATPSTTSKNDLSSSKTDKKSKRTITDQTNSLESSSLSAVAKLAGALASSDIEEEVETNVKDRNRKKDAKVKAKLKKKKRETNKIRNAKTAGIEWDSSDSEPEK